MIIWLKIDAFLLPNSQITTFILWDATLTVRNLHVLLSLRTLRAVRFIKVQAKTEDTLCESRAAGPVSIDDALCLLTPKHLRLNFFHKIPTGKNRVSWENSQSLC